MNVFTSLLAELIRKEVYQQGAVPKRNVEKNAVVFANGQEFGFTTEGF